MSTTPGYAISPALPGPYLIVAGLNLAQPNEPVRVHTFLGAGDNIYASRQNLYVTVTGYGRPVARIPSYDPDTYIYKFALDGGRVSYAARGKVPGTVLNQFSMDEYSGHFRIATTSENPWGGGGDTSRNNVYILDKELSLRGKLKISLPVKGSIPCASWAREATWSPSGPWTRFLSWTWRIRRLPASSAL